MQNIKYHAINIMAVTIFSFAAASTANQVVRLSMSTFSTKHQNRKVFSRNVNTLKSFDEYQSIIDSGFFVTAETNESTGIVSAPSSIGNLRLLGTITGPASIARALIKENTKKDPEIFKMWSDVHGHKLVRISNSKVYLKTGDQIEILDMYDKNKKDFRRSHSRSASKIKRTISKAELQQKVFNNIDNALRGLRAGPYRVNGKVEGYKLIRLRPYNILYKMGARSGDIVKRINGHPIDSTEKLVKLWESVKGDSNINIDLIRRGKHLNFQLTITD